MYDHRVHKKQSRQRIRPTHHRLKTNTRKRIVTGTEYHETRRSSPGFCGPRRRV